MPRPDPGPAHNALDDLSAARNEALRAAHRIALDAGARPVSRPAFPGSEATVPDVEPLAGARAARKIEIGARTAASRYIRDAREAGHTGYEIGEALGMVPRGDADQDGATVAEAAYTYAAGRPNPDASWQPRRFIWHCPSCDKTISDHGLIQGPADDEMGHAEDCPRLVAAVAEWDASWEAEP